MWHGGASGDEPRRRDQPWWDDDAASSDSSGRTGSSAPPDLPAWAARNLSDPGQEELLARSWPGRGRHGMAPVVPGRVRGWGLAVVALAAAAGAVPLAVSTLAHQDAPLPRVGTFPVSSPGDLTASAGRPAPLAPEHDVFADPADGAQAGHDAPAPVAVAPLARSRSTEAARPAAPPVTRTVTPRVAPQPRTVSPRPVTPRSPVRTSVTSVDPIPAPRSEDEGSGSGRGSSRSSGESSGGSSGGLLGGVGRTVGGVTSAVGSVLH